MEKDGATVVMLSITVWSPKECKFLSLKWIVCDSWQKLKDVSLGRNKVNSSSSSAWSITMRRRSREEYLTFLTIGREEDNTRKSHSTFSRYTLLLCQESWKDSESKLKPLLESHTVCQEYNVHPIQTKVSATKRQIIDSESLMREFQERETN
jgi:hypothetical protein